MSEISKLNGYDIKDKKAIRFYDNVESMKSDTTLKESMHVKTKGYYTANDGGEGTYIIREKAVSDVIDEGSIIEINQDLVAELLIIDKVSYNQFGATGNGITNDFESIYNTHVFANNNNLEVIGYPKSVYYIGYADKEIPVYTNTDFNNAKIIIDDTDENVDKSLSIFKIKSKYNKKELNISSITKDTKTIDLTGITLETNALVELENSNKKQFIRNGLNADNGKNQFDSFRVDKYGTIIDTILWNFDTITSATIVEIGDEPIEFGNLIIETKVNNQESIYDYFYRNIYCERSNTLIKNITHYLTNEDSLQSKPYDGIIYISNCCNVIVDSCQLSAHKTFMTLNDVPMGSYDIRLNKAIDVYFRNCKQINSITDTTKWGIFTSNYCKNITFDRCILNRFDAHRGVNNVLIEKSIIGYQGIRCVGFGDLIIRDTKFVDTEILIELRNDYGSFWNGDIKLNNITVDCKFLSNRDGRMIVNGKNDGTHDFGYTCYYPNIYVDGIKFNNKIDDTKTNFAGISVFYIYNSGKGEITNDYNPIMGKTISIKNAKCESISNGYVVFGSGIDITLNKLYCSTNSQIEGRYTNDIYSRKKALKITPNFNIILDNVDIEYTTGNFCNILGYGEPDISDTFTLYNSPSPRLLPQVDIYNCKNIVSFPQYPAIFNYFNCKIDRITSPSEGSISLDNFNNCLIAPAGYIRHLESNGNTITYSYLNDRVLVSPVNDKSTLNNCYFEGIEEYQTSLDQSPDSALYKRMYRMFNYIGTIENSSYLRNGYDINNCVFSDKILYKMSQDDCFWFNVYDYFNSTLFNDDLGLIPRKVGYTSSIPTAITISRPSGSQSIDLKEGSTYINVSTDTMSIYLNNEWKVISMTS